MGGATDQAAMALPFMGGATGQAAMDLPLFWPNIWYRFANVWYRDVSELAAHVARSKALVIISEPSDMAASAEID